MISLSSKDSIDFSFERESLSWQILQRSDPSLTGHWQHEFQPACPQFPRYWHLTLYQGNALFCGPEPMTAQGLLEAAERYLPNLKGKKAVPLIQSLKQMLYHEAEQRPTVISTLIESCHRLNLFSPEQLQQALRLHLLSELDKIAFDCSGQARFLPNPALATQLPISGFDLSALMADARKRRIIWSKVRKIVPSSQTAFALDQEAIERADLPATHRMRLSSFLRYGQTSADIARSLCQDELAVAKQLAQLTQQGFLKAQSERQNSKAKVVIVDDSQLMLQMFQTLVSGWGYDVYSHADPRSALDIMVEAAPKAIFLDVNMPEISGFDLLKQIRRQPSLRETPLIMLTAERTLSNNWRAQWSGCKFLSKPLSPDEIPQFRLDLRMLLETVAQ